MFLLEYLEEKFPNINKWTCDPNIDKVLSNRFWTNPQRSKSQITQVLKFCTGQYMGNICKHLFWPNRFQNSNCDICHLNEQDTWSHVLLKYNNSIIHALRIKRHNKAIWKLCKLLLFVPSTRCYTLMNAGTYMNSPPDNTVPSWLIQCSCNTPRCQCNARFRSDLLCVQGIPYKGTPPTKPNPNIKIQFIEYSYTNDRFADK